MSGSGPACPQCGAPLRTVDAARLDCARCGAVVLLDGAPSRTVPWFLAAIGVVGGLLVMPALLVAVFATRAADVPVPVKSPVVDERPAPVSSPMAASFAREPDFLEDADAMAALPSRIFAATDAFSGQVQHLIVDRTPVAVALVQVGPGAVDSVVFSFGQVVHATVPLDADAQARLPAEVFPLTPDQLAAVPALVDRVEAAGPPGVRVERAMFTAVGPGPRLELERSHPREVLPALTFDLDGRPLE